MKSWGNYPSILTAKQAAELLGVSRINTITSLCKNGELPATKIGQGSWRIDRDRLRMMFAPKLQKNRSLTDQLGEIELALSTLSTIHRDEPIAEAIRTAHEAALEVYTQARNEE